MIDAGTYGEVDTLPPAYLDHVAHLATLDRYPLVQEGTVFHCRLNAERIDNLARQGASEVDGRYRALSRPHILHVGVTTYCNLSCPACPTGNSAMGRPAEHLDFPVYRRVVEEIGEGLMLMLFWDWGEPLMHPRIADMIALASARDIKTVISTNGSVADSPRHLQRLVAAAPTQVIVCVDGARQASFEKYRVGGSLARVLDTVERLAELRAAAGSDYPVIEFRSLATRYNEHEFPQLLALAQDRGADVFSVKSLRPYDYRGVDIDDELAPLTDRFARYRYGDHGPSAQARRMESGGPLRCRKPLFAPTLNSDGQLAFCSYVGEDEGIFGAIPDSGFDALWTGRASQQRKQQFLDRQGIDSCTRCFFRGDHPPTMLYTVALGALPADYSLQEPWSSAAFLGEYRRLMRAIRAADD